MRFDTYKKQRTHQNERVLCFLFTSVDKAVKTLLPLQHIAVIWRWEIGKAEGDAHLLGFDGADLFKGQ